MENNTIGKILFTEEQIQKRAAEIGKQIAEDYAGEEVYLVGTLRGAVVWMGDLMKHITNDAEIDFIVASSYGSGKTTSGVVKVKKDLEGDIYECHHHRRHRRYGHNLKVPEETSGRKKSEEHKDLYTP